MSKNPWLEELHGRKGKSVKRYVAPKITRQSLEMIVEQTPEVLFKISRSVEKCANKTSALTGAVIPGKVIHPSPRNRQALQGLVNYISRVDSETEGQIELMDEQGLTYNGPDAVAEATWGWGMPEQSNRREALHIIMGMPRDTADGGLTDVAAVERACVATAEKLFSNHRYIIAHHIDSESGHPHAHLIVKVASNDGSKRLDPKRRDLMRYRETFALDLRENGVKANATSRLARLSTRQSIDQASYRRLKNDKGMYDIPPGRLEERKTRRPSYAHIDQLTEYLKLSSALSKSNDEKDQALSSKLVQFIADATNIPREAQKQAPIDKQVPTQKM